MISLGYRRWRALLGLALLVSLASAPASGQGPPRKFALLIGIDRYLGGGIQGVNELKYAVKDARSLKDALEERGWITTVVAGEAADRQRIVRELYDLALAARIEDKVLVYFAGHGVRDPVTSGATYWLTYEATIATLVAEGIRLNHILEYVRDIPAREKIVLLDHCYSGDIKVTAAAAVPVGPEPATGSGRFVPGEPELDTDPVARALYPPDIERLEEQTEDLLVVLGAARGPAYEDDSWGHGMFTKAILDVLEDPNADSSPKDGKISLSEFWTGVSSKVDAMATQKGVAQRPFGSAIQADQMTWPLFDASVDAGSEAQELRSLLTALDLAAPLDFEIKFKVIELLGTWELKAQQGIAQDSSHRRVVDELRFYKDQGMTIAPENKKQSLEALVRGLGLVSSG